MIGWWCGWQLYGGALAVIIFSMTHVRADTSDHRYKAGDQVPLYANKVSPYYNPSETYRYYDLPFCSPDQVHEKKGSLGEVLSGDRWVTTPYKLDFLADRQNQFACKKNLSKEEVAIFRNAVAKDYNFQMSYDDLPIWGFLGRVDVKGNTYLYKHWSFEILYNKDRVISIRAGTEYHSLINITEAKEVDLDLMYSVKWVETNTSFEKRMERYTKFSSLPKIMPIINISVTVLTVTAFLAIVFMKVLNNDLVKYTHDEELMDDGEETGWKYIHGDVFRYPKYDSLLAAALGCGSQLFILTICMLALALFGVFYPYNRGSLLSALVVIYALTFGIAGYSASSFYHQLEGANWVQNLLLTGSLFCGPLILTFCFLNTIAFSYSTTTTLPFRTTVVIYLIWALVASTMLVLGGIIGKNGKPEFQAPCRTSKYPREIPPLPWYRRTLPQMAIAGFLPFGTIYVKLYYIFASLWGHRFYTYYGVLSILFVILIIVTAFITVALTFYQLGAEDHEWWWRSFLCGGSTGLFMYGYCFYYYFMVSGMSGFMQTSFFFGYMACVCYAVFLMLGTVGFGASLFFVRHIYHSIKCE